MKTLRRTWVVCLVLSVFNPCSIRGSLYAESKQLTKDGRSCQDPVYVQNGKEVVFTRFESPVQSTLLRLKLANGSIEPLHPQATTSEFEPAFSRDGRYYAFVQSRGNLNLKLIIRDADNGKEDVFDPGGGFASLRRPSFSPDAKTLVFSIPAANGQHIVSVDREGKNRKTMTQIGLNQMPAFSPDGKHIAFASSREGDMDLFVMKADGSDVRQITKSPGLDIRPAWSPDGKRLAFTSNRDGNYEIYACNADGSGAIRVTNHPERDDYASWHPDGGRLVVVSERMGSFDLYEIEAPK